MSLIPVYTPIRDLRKKTTYRFLESFLGLLSIFFLSTLVILAIVSPILLSLFLICYSFFMVFKIGIHGIYSIFSYKNLRRWEKLNYILLFENFAKKDFISIESQLLTLKNKYKDNINWSSKLDEDITKLQNYSENDILPNEVFHLPIFAVYNESFSVIKRSIQKIYESGYDLSKIVIIITQEARIGEEKNQDLFQKIKNLDWTNTFNLSLFKEIDLVENLYQRKYNSILEKKKKISNFSIKNDRLNIIFTQHPDGLVGEIKGKASNEDWGARVGTLFIHSQKLNPKNILVTSLDADSKVGNNFFQMLSFRFCFTENRLNKGYQPLPIYSNNYLTANLFPRLVATNTTIWYMIQMSITDELHFFANYSVPLDLLIRVDFWNREVIAEDSLLFSRCFITLEGNFEVIPFYGTFEGDTVVGEDYFETVLNQYLQLQRWAWGGIEGFAYKFWYFFIDKKGKSIDVRKRINLIRIEILNHFFWATSPVVFSVINLLPFFLSSREFRESPVQYNLWVFSQYFAWISFIFLVICSYITFRYIFVKAKINEKSKWYHFITLTLQWVISPFIYILWAPPALDVQIRGMLGKYLGYWVTPKK